MTTQNFEKLSKEEQVRIIQEMLEVDKEREFLEQFDWNYENWRKKQKSQT